MVEKMKQGYHQFGSQVRSGLMQKLCWRYCEDLHDIRDEDEVKRRRKGCKG